MSQCCAWRHRPLFEERVGSATQTFLTIIHSLWWLSPTAAYRQLASSRSSTPPARVWPCDRCSRTCSSRIGLFAHQRTYRWHNPSYSMVHSVYGGRPLWVNLWNIWKNSRSNVWLRSGLVHSRLLRWLTNADAGLGLCVCMGATATSSTFIVISDVANPLLTFSC